MVLWHRRSTSHGSGGSGTVEHFSHSELAVVCLDWPTNCVDDGLSSHGPGLVTCVGSPPLGGKGIVLLTCMVHNVLALLGMHAKPSLA